MTHENGNVQMSELVVPPCVIVLVLVFVLAVHKIGLDGS